MIEEKNMKKFGWILCLLLLVAAFTGCNATEYKKAVELYESGQYAQAQNIFEELGEYEDSQAKAQDCRYMQGQALMESGKYEEAEEIFRKLGNYKDSNTYAQDCRYMQGQTLMESEKYEEAEDIFQKLGNYKDSNTYAQDCKWYLFAEYVENNDVSEMRNNASGLPYSFSIERTSKNSFVVKRTGDHSRGLVSASTDSSMTIKKSSSSAEIVSDEKVSVFGQNYTVRGMLALDMSKYKKTSKLEWDTTENGEYKQSSGTLIIKPSKAEEEVLNLVKYLEDVVKNSGLSVTMADLGFASYK